MNKVELVPCGLPRGFVIYTAFAKEVVPMCCSAHGLAMR